MKTQTLEPETFEAGSADRCPTCDHVTGSERFTRGGRIRGEKTTRCCHTTVVQDALVDDTEVCHCANRWHTSA